MQLARIGALLRDGHVREAEAACAEILAAAPDNAAATHFMGLVRSRQGDADAGERLLRRSVELDPAEASFRSNLGNFLRRSGRLVEAESEYRRALQLAPHDGSARHSLALTLNDLGRPAEAERECRLLLRGNERDADGWSALGLILDRQNRLFEAEEAYRRAIGADPRYALAHHNLGTLLARMDRAEESLDALERARALGVSGFESLASRGKALTLLYRLDEAEAALAEAVALRPGDPDAQLNLARLRYMRGDPAFARSIAAAAAANSKDLELTWLYAVVLLRAGRHEAAEAELRDALRRAGPQPRLRLALSEALRDAGRLQEAEAEALEAAIALPNDPAVVENLISILLARGRSGEALQFLRGARARDPAGQGWIAYEGLASRLIGDPHYSRVFDYGRLVRTYDIEPPAGWSSIAELNGALIEALSARHRFKTHPLDQSLRHGSQTTRNLIADPHPAIQAILRAFQAPIRMYVDEVGREANHPLTARNRGAASISAAWSVRLHRGGFHLNHFHHQGWISSAYYIEVPDEVSDETARSGWLKFGEPRFPTPGAVAERYVRPSPGRLVLFPSYMWHGTQAIHGSQPRLTIAFDAAPA